MRPRFVLALSVFLLPLSARLAHAQYEGYAPPPPPIPPEVVQQQRDKIAETEKQIAAIETNLKELQ